MPKFKNNIEFIEYFFEHSLNKDDIDTIDEYFSKDIIMHGPASGQLIVGIEQYKNIYSSYINAYAKKQFIIDEIHEVGDSVYVRWTCEGKFQGEYKGILTNSATFSIEGFTTYTVIDYKITETRQWWDRLGLLEQLGEVSVQTTEAIEPGYYIKILKSLGLEKYVENAPLLSRRERECLQCLLVGKTAKETAKIYKISSRTVEAHFENIKRKLNLSTKKDVFIAAQALEKLNLL